MENAEVIRFIEFLYSRGLLVYSPDELDYEEQLHEFKAQEVRKKDWKNQ